MICEPVREHALIGKGGVCQDERHFRKAHREVREWIHPRHSAAGVDQSDEVSPVSASAQRSVAATRSSGVGSTDRRWYARSSTCHI